MENKAAALAREFEENRHSTSERTLLRSKIWGLVVSDLLLDSAMAINLKDSEHDTLHLGAGPILPPRTAHNSF